MSNLHVRHELCVERGAKATCGSPSKPEHLAESSQRLRELSGSLGRVKLIWDSVPKTVLIVHKYNDEGLYEIIEEFCDWLIQSGFTVYVEDVLKLKMTARIESKLNYWNANFCCKHAEKIDFVVSLGGDGTVLKSAWLFQEIVPPIFPFYFGSLGFLTGLEYGNYKKILSNMDSGLTVNIRMRLECILIRNGSTVEEMRCKVLNEIVLDRGPTSSMCTLDVYGDESLLTTVQADGVVIATPTGSTAYSLSAGGSLVHPLVPSILITPICPHTLSFRPMILPEFISLEIKVPQTARSSAWASFDGRSRVELKTGDSLKVFASAYPVPTVCNVNQTKDWFDSLGKCLHWNARRTKE